MTVLFADVTGSMELAEQVDPEEWHAILDRFFDILTSGVHRYEGSINQYTGDGVMALFGAPIAHEDHAHRACYAALHLLGELRSFAHELKRERGLTFAVRMGLNSGEVVVGKIGDDLRMDYTAQGHVVGLAARLQALADPGKAYLSESTAALVTGFFELESLGTFRVKGVTDAVTVFSLEGVGRMRTRLDVSRARGLSRFVGRADEMAVLEAALARASDGRGQVIGVVAEAGTGKSRLCTEFTERCRSRGIRVHEGRGVAHGKLLPFLPLLELLREVFGLDERDGPRESRQKIAGALVLVDRRFEEFLPLVFDFLGVPDPDRPAPPADPGDRQRQLFAMIARLLRALGTREPCLILLEDLHWFDDGTVAFLDSLVEAVTATKTLVFLNFRPEFRAPWMEKATYQQLPLPPLGSGAIGELLDYLLGRDASVAGLRELIRERSAGNPFFVEEAVQSLLESGELEGHRGACRLVRPLAGLRVPPTVQSLLAARIDRLPERERNVLQAAAVIGKRFPESILARVVDLPRTDLADALRTLRGRDLVFEEILFPEVEYAFKHPLTQEVAYGSQLAEHRRRAHGAVARLLEESEPQDERAALVAHHWEAAGERLPAARWHRRAAEWSETSAPGSAAAHWRTVRAQAAAAPDCAEARGLRIAACIGLLRAADYERVDPADIDSSFEEGRRLALEAGDSGSRVRMLLAYSALVLQEGHLDRSAALLAEAEEVAATTNDAELRFVVRGHAGFASIVRGEQREALKRYDEAFAALGDVRPSDSFVLRRYLGAGVNRAMIVAEMGRLDDAARELEALSGAARAAGDLSYQCIVELCICRLAIYRGESRPAIDHAREALEIAERMGLAGFRAGTRVALAAAYMLAGAPGEAIAALEDAERESAADLLAPSQRLTMLARFAEAHLARGDRAKALALSEQAVAAIGTTRRLGAADAYLARARVLLATEGATRAADVAALLDAAATTAERCSARIYEPLILEQRACLAEALGDEAETKRRLREALAAARELNARGHAARLAREVGEDGGDAVRVA